MATNIMSAASLPLVPSNMDESDYIQAMPNDVVIGCNGHFGTKEFYRIVSLFSNEYNRQPVKCRGKFAKDLRRAMMHDTLIPRRMLRSVDGTVYQCIEMSCKRSIAMLITQILEENQTGCVDTGSNVFPD